MSRKILGILGSTRIKSVLIDENGAVLASGIFEWENTLVDGLWSYSLEDAERGVRESYSRLVKDYGEDIRNLNAIGVSAMMHGYLAFDKDGVDNLCRSERGAILTRAKPRKNFLSCFPLTCPCAGAFRSTISHISIRWSM